jgi:hypothetical protein
LIIYLLFRLPAVQTWTAKKIANYLSSELKANIQVKGVDIDLFKTIVLEEFLIEDQHQDTLLYVNALKVNIDEILVKENKFSINKIKLVQPVFHLRMYKNEKFNNMHFLLDYFSSEKDTTTKVKTPLNLTANKIIIESADFIYHNENLPEGDKEVINYDNVHVKNFSAEINNFILANGDIKAQIKNLTLQEKSGFKINKFRANLKFTKTEIEAANLYVLTPHSSIHDYYSMRFDSIADMSDYIHKVRMYADFEQSIVSFKDIKYFASAIKNYTQKFMINGYVYGTVSHLQSKNIKINTGKSTKVNGAISVKGLPEIETTIFNAKLEKLNTNYTDLVNLMYGLDLDSVATSLPNFLSNLGNVDYSGYYKGTVFDFYANGNIITDIGNVVNDIHMNIESDKIPSYDGNIETIGLDLGKLFSQKMLGAASLNLIVDGEGFDIKELNANIGTQIKNIYLNGYNYTNLEAKGIIDKKLFNGNFKANDPNAKFDFKGSIDFNNLKQPEFKFESTISALHLRELKWIKDTINISTNVNVDFIGANLDNIIGSVYFNNTEIQNGTDSFVFKNIDIESIFIPKGKKLSLNSEIINASIEGEYKLSTIQSAVKSLVKIYLPNANLGKIYKYEDQDFNFHLFVKDANPITQLLYPNLNISESATIRGYLNTNTNTIRLNGQIDYIKYDALKFENLMIDGENDKNIFDFNVAADKAFISDSINIDNIAISNAIKNDSVKFNIKLAELTNPNQLDLNGLVSFKENKTKIAILPSVVIIDYQSWELKDSFNIDFINDKRILVNNFELRNGNQLVQVSGYISNQNNEELSIDIQNVDLKSFNQLFKKYDLTVLGTLNSRTKFASLLSEPLAISDINIDHLIYNSDTIGNLLFSNTWDPKSQLINLTGSIFNERLKTLSVAGSINTSKAKNNLNIDVLMNETELIVIEPFVKSYVSNISGTASADLKVRGSFSKPEINGYLTLKNAGLRVNYLNAYLKVSDQIRLSENKIFLNNLQVKDLEGNKGSINGSITHTYFEKFNLDVRLQANNLLCLNTTAKDNELYYGKAYSTGSFSFRGPIEDIKIDITAKTERGTKFYIPLSDESSVMKQNFVRFVQKDSTVKAQDYKINLSGISMNMNLQVDDQSEVQLIMDKNTGEIIKGRGNANLKLTINTIGNFEMYGNYEISEGEYNFTLQNLISKKFKVEKGGTIRWNGDPLKAKIDLSAIYETRPVVQPLVLSANSTDTNSYTSTQRVKAQCVLNLKNDLMSPDISFGLRFPEDENLSSKVGGYLANQDNLSNQVASLLVFGRFANTGSTNYLPTTGFLASQLSSLVSTKNFDLNLENGVGGSLRLFNDRITIDGNINTNNNSTTNTNTQQTNASAITGDVNIEYKISKDGRFRAKGFQRNDINSDLLKRGNSQVEQGVGLFYRIEFDTFKELYQKVFKKKQDQ